MQVSMGQFVWWVFVVRPSFMQIYLFNFYSFVIGEGREMWHTNQTLANRCKFYHHIGVFLWYQHGNIYLSLRHVMSHRSSATPLSSVIYVRKHHRSVERHPLYFRSMTLIRWETRHRLRICVWPSEWLFPVPWNGVGTT